MKYFLAIDIGASSGRHILGWLEKGKLETCEIYRFPNSPKNVNGKLTWDVNALFNEILNGLKIAGEQNKIPYSVSIDTWGVDYVLLDEFNNPLGDSYCYRDNRTSEQISKVHSVIPFEKLFEKTGIAFNSFNTVYQLNHDLQSGKMSSACDLLMIPDYFHFKLSGVKVQEYTNATTTGMVNANTNEWDDEIIQKLGFNKNLFKKLSKPGTQIGEFTDEVAKIVGYKAKVVLPATHDTASAVVATPLSGQTPYISSGTWSLLGVEQNKAHTDKQSMNSLFSNEGGINNTFRLQKNIMGLWMIQQIKKELGEKYDFQTLANLAEQNPVEYLINVNDQRFLAPKSMIDEINQTVGEKLSVGEMAYCIFNNLAIDYANSIKILQGITGESYETLNIIGGGSKNQLLNKLTAKHTKMRIITGPAEGTAIGNLLMQLLSAGEIQSIKIGREIIKKSFDIKEI